MTRQIVLSVLNSLSALAAARLRGDSEGEAMLLSELSTAELGLFGQGATVVISDLPRHGGSLADGSPTAEAVSPRLLAAARLTADGDRVTAHALIERPKLSADDAVDSVAAAWLALHDGDREAALLFSQKMCSAYRAALAREVG